ncbi:MAG TPA: response regulator [Candidatus Limnocylindrales bacterium]|nr:response regulator [Candidatus Limnocylindrales bacterium]
MGTEVRSPMAGGEPRDAAPDASEDVAANALVVLVVDDEPVVRAWLARALTREGIHVVVAADGRQALRLIADGAVHAQVLLTDLEMPSMGGVELAARVHALRPSMRIVMMTGDPEKAANAREHSTIVAAVLDKPVMIPDLIVAVRPGPQHAVT